MISDSIQESGRPFDETLLRSELFSLIESWSLKLPSPLSDDVPLISSGILDSLALFSLTIWIESKIGRNIDPTRVDIAADWDSVGNILRYVQLESAGPEPTTISPVRAQARPLTDTEYRVVKYEPKHKSAVAEFQTRLWSAERACNIRYLEWKYERNPYQDDIIIYLAFHGNDVVGMRGFYGSRWETGVPARQFNILVADDLTVREDHRNAGVTTRIMRTAFDDLRKTGNKFLFNLSGGPLTVLGSLVTGWRSCGTLDPWRRISRSAKRYAAFRQVVKRVPYVRRYIGSPIFSDAAELEPFSRLDRAQSPIISRDGPPIHIDKNARPDAMADLVERIGHDGRLRHVRDKAFFEWRFGNPLHEYRFLFAGTKPLDGYLVLKTSVNRSDRRVGIVDLEAINHRVQTTLLEAAVNAGCFAEMFIWTATAGEALLKELRALRFEPLNSNQKSIEQPCFLVRALEEDGPDENWRLANTPLLDIKNWDIRIFYTMAG